MPVETTVTQAHPEARARALELVDAGSFTETHADVRPGGVDVACTVDVVTGFGRVDGRRVCVVVQCDPGAEPGLGWATGGDKVAALLDTALRMRAPVVIVVEGGARAPENDPAVLAVVGDLLRRQVRASGIVPQVHVSIGPDVGVCGTLGPLADFVVAVDDGTRDTAHLLADGPADALECVRELLAYLPDHADATPVPMHDAAAAARPAAADSGLADVLPATGSQPYDVRAVVEHVLDHGVFLELQAAHAANVVVGLGDLGGAPVGVVANQPAHLAGTIDIDAAEKAARFVRVCDAFDIPLLTLVDVPGFLPGKEQEWRGIIRRGAKLLFAYAETTVPTVTVTLRKAFGGAQVVMGSRHLGADLSLAWPSAQIAVMGAGGAVSILHRRHLDAVAAAGADAAAERDRLVAAYEAEVMGAGIAARRGFIDAVVAPQDTRRVVTEAFAALRGGEPQRTPRRKHENVPL